MKTWMKTFMAGCFCEGAALYAVFSIPTDRWPSEAVAMGVFFASVMGIVGLILLGLTVMFAENE